jgi:cardiolipin synthase
MFSWPFFTALYYVSEWVMRLVMLVVVTRRRQPASAMAWLLVIFFLPWLGLVLYLLIGSNRLPRRRIEQKALVLGELAAIGQRFENHPSLAHPELGPDATAAVGLAERLGYLPILGGNAVQLIAKTDDFLDRLAADIDAAREHVHLLFYIWADDATGRRVADALARAAARGVKCRVLVDAVGSRPMLKGLAPQMVRQGIEVHPVLRVGLFRRHAARLDLRNHRKVAVIDGRIGYTGSQNIVDASYGHKDLAWRDLMVRLTGPVVLELQAVFVMDWYGEMGEVPDPDAIFPDPPCAGSIPVQTLPSGPTYATENYQRIVVAALYAAREHVIITTPYFVPDEPFLQAIQVAVLRGVDVELIVPRRSDQVLVGAASRAYYDDVLASGVKLHLYDRGLLHAKTMSIDGKLAMIGSSNFDIRSFALNFEINMLFYGPEVAEQLRAQQQQYISESEPLTQEEWNHRPALHRIGQNIARLLSPLL